MAIILSLVALLTIFTVTYLVSTFMQMAQEVGEIHDQMFKDKEQDDKPTKP